MIKHRVLVALDSVGIDPLGHGHLDQVAFSHGHPKSKVPTWYFGPDAETQAELFRRPEGIFAVLTGLPLNGNAVHSCVPLPG